MGVKCGSKRPTFYLHFYFYVSSPNVVLTSSGLTKLQFPKASGRLERVSFPQQSAPHDFKKLSDHEVMLLTSDAHRDYNEQEIISEEAALVFGDSYTPYNRCFIPFVSVSRRGYRGAKPAGIHDEKPIRRELSSDCGGYNCPQTTKAASS